MQDILKFRSSISQGRLQKAALIGFFKAFPGICLLFYVSVFPPPEQLEFWGPVSFIIASFFLAWGLIPYKRLLKLEKKPNEIVVDENAIWIYLLGKKPQRIDWDDIAQILYVKKIFKSGIELQLINGSKIFLPYFSSRVFSELEEVKASHQEIHP